jgi:hypothetical protein
VILQVNTSGAWRNVVEFDAADRPKMVAALIPIAKLVPQAKWCLLDERGQREWLRFL